MDKNSQPFLGHVELQEVNQTDETTQLIGKNATLIDNSPETSAVSSTSTQREDVTDYRTDSDLEESSGSSTNISSDDNSDDSEDDVPSPKRQRLSDISLDTEDSVAVAADSFPDTERNASGSSNTDEKVAKDLVEMVSFYRICPATAHLPNSSTVEVIQKIMNKRSGYSKVGRYGDDLEFSIAVYKRQKSFPMKLLNSFGVFEKNNTITCILFYYNEKEIYAIATRNGGDLLRSFADYDFPSKIAARILNEDGMLSKSERPIIGTDRKRDRIHKKHHRIKCSDPVSYNVSYTSELRKNSSVLQLDCFQDQVLVSVRLASIRFLQLFEKEDFPKIISHFSTIMRGDTTFSVTGEKEVDNIEAHRNFLRKVPVPTKILLDTELSTTLMNCINNPDCSVALDSFRSYDFCYKKVDDFAGSTNFKLEFKFRSKSGNPKIVGCWNKPPLFEIIILQIRIWLLKNENVKHTPRSNNVGFFKKLKFSFKPLFGEKCHGSLLAFINGELLSNCEGSSVLYWHINNQWFQVVDEYLTTTERRFLDLLQEKLINKNETFYLRNKYPNTKLAKTRKSQTPGPSHDQSDTQKSSGRINSEDEYNKSYENEIGYVVGDKILSQNIELFDILYYDETTEATYLYHVKEGFGQKTRDACSQIRNSAEIISGALRPSDDHVNILEPFYDQLIKKHENYDLPKIFDTFNSFAQALRKAYFVYAVADTSSGKQKRSAKSIRAQVKSATTTAKRSFAEVINNKTQVFQLDIKNKLSELEMNSKDFDKFSEALCGEIKTSDEIADRIISELRSNNYVNSSGFVTSKLLYLNKKDFELPGLKKNAKPWGTVFKILEPYLTSYNTLIGKMEILRLPTDLTALGYEGKFLICEIDIEDS